MRRRQRHDLLGNEMFPSKADGEYGEMGLSDSSLLSTIPFSLCMNVAWRLNWDEGELVLGCWMVKLHYRKRKMTSSFLHKTETYYEAMIA